MRNAELALPLVLQRNLRATPIPHSEFRTPHSNRSVLKKTALRPFSFERTGGPPPSVVFALASLYLEAGRLRLAVLYKVIFWVRFDFPVFSKNSAWFSRQALAVFCTILFETGSVLKRSGSFLPQIVMQI